MRPKLASYSTCTGCGICSAVCNKGAITMLYDKNGHLMPILQKDKCVMCGKCENICPHLNKTTSVKSILFHSANDIRTFTAWSKDESVCLHGTSGGVFSQLAYDCLKNNDLAIVFGAELSDHNTCKHIGITQIEELYRIVGTKYIQSDVSDAYRECKKALANGYHSIFCGTPCQIAGLYVYLGHVNKDKLLTVELICHGVPSRYISEVSCQYYGAHHIVSYRNKNTGWHKGFDCTYANKKGEIITKNTGKEFFFRNFGGTHRPSCYHCTYAKIERCADITLGDAWGLQKKYPQRASLGANLVICNSSKGLQILTDSQTIHFIPESNNTLNAPTLFMPIEVGACAFSKYLFFINKLPHRIKIATISMDWRSGWYLIPFVIWRRIIVKRYQLIFKKKLLFTRKQNGWL